MENYHLSIWTAFLKESMINRISNLINHNRSAANISQVLWSTKSTPCPRSSLSNYHLLNTLRHNDTDMHVWHICPFCQATYGFIKRRGRGKPCAGWQKLREGTKVFFGSQTVFLGKRCTITWYTLHVILSLICKFAITRKNDAFVAKIVNTCLTKSFMASFALAERLPTSATLALRKGICSARQGKNSHKLATGQKCALTAITKWFKGGHLGVLKNKSLNSKWKMEMIAIKGGRGPTLNDKCFKSFPSFL